MDATAQAKSADLETRLEASCAAVADAAALALKKACLRALHARIDGGGGELCCKAQPIPVSHAAQFTIDALEAPLG